MGRIPGQAREAGVASEAAMGRWPPALACAVVSVLVTPWSANAATTVTNTFSAPTGHTSLTAQSSAAEINRLTVTASGAVWTITDTAGVVNGGGCAAPVGTSITCTTVGPFIDLDVLLGPGNDSLMLGTF